MSNLEQIITLTTLYISRGQGLETIFEKYGDTENIKLVAIKFKSAPSSEHSLVYQIGPARCKLQKGLIITAQTWYDEEVADFIENYEIYQDIASKRGDGGVFDRGACEKIYLLDKETNTVAEYGLVPKKDRIYTPEYKELGIRALNPKYQVSLELTGNLFTLEDKNKLKKWRTLKTTDFTRPQLERMLPSLCAATKIRTCNRTRKAIITEQEISCRFDGDTPKHFEVS